LESVEEYHQRVYMDALKPKRMCKTVCVVLCGCEINFLPGEHTNTLRVRGNKVLQILV